MLTPDDDDERPCRHCGRHQGECDGPPQRCCELCEHWHEVPLAEEGSMT